MWTKFKVIQALMVFLVTCKNDEDQSKNEAGIFLGQILSRMSAPIPKAKMRCFPQSEIKIPDFFFFYFHSITTYTHFMVILYDHCILFLLFNCINR